MEAYKNYRNKTEKIFSLIGCAKNDESYKTWNHLLLSHYCGTETVYILTFFFCFTSYVCPNSGFIPTSGFLSNSSCVPTSTFSLTSSFIPSLVSDWLPVSVGLQVSVRLPVLKQFKDWSKGFDAKKVICIYPFDTFTSLRQLVQKQLPCTFAPFFLFSYRHN